jgi:transcriptional regulator with XRE-family HTH domain
MTNERLRDAMIRAGVTPADLAREVGVDPKTVERWTSQGRLPYPKHRNRAAALLGESEAYLWPQAVTGERRAQLSESEVVRFYPRRAEIPRDTWERLLRASQSRVDILVYAGLFFPEQMPTLAATLCEKVTEGVQVRILMARPDGEQVARRGQEEGIGDVVQGRVRNALSFFEPHARHGCIQLRLHDTTLYNSIFRFDDEMLVNTHVFGLPAAHAPVIHLRQLDGAELFSIYGDSFDRVWQSSAPIQDPFPVAAAPWVATVRPDQIVDLVQPAAPR